MAPETNNPCSWADWRVVSWSVIKRPKTNKKRTRACSRLLLHSLIDTPAGKLLNPGPIFHAPLQSQPSFVFQRRKSRRAAAAAAGAWASNFPEARSKPKVPTITFYARKNFHHNKKKPDPSPSFTGVRTRLVIFFFLLRLRLRLTPCASQQRVLHFGVAQCGRAPPLTARHLLA